MARTLQEMPKMGLNVWSLSEVELLQVLTLNLCGCDPGLEAGSRLAIKSNLVIYLVPYIKRRHQHYEGDEHKNEKNMDFEFRVYFFESK